MNEIESKIIDKVIEKLDIESISNKIDIDVLTDKVAEKVANEILKRDYMNPFKDIPSTPVPKIPTTVDPSPFIPDQVVMYGCTPTDYDLTNVSQIDKVLTNSKGEHHETL